MNRIVVPTDFSSESERPFEHIAEQARKLGLGIALLHVIRESVMLSGAAPGTGAPLPQPDVATERADAEKQLRVLRERFGDVDVTTEVRINPNPAKTIADYADEIHAAGIALATHGRTGLRRLVLGSVAENVLRRAKCPVTCYPAG